MLIKKQRITVLMLFLVSVMQVFSAKAQTISNHLFGQNAWMPDSIGNTRRYGQLDSKWPEIKASGAQMMRYGGITLDKNKPTNYQYIKMIDKIRSNGMEPVVQVPFHNGQYSAQEAAAIVRYVNVTMNRGVKYWVIGNEPDLEYGFTNAGQVAWYIKSFASAMKAQDPTIKTIGPETAWYNTNIIYGLTTPGGANDITGKDANGRFYIDYISFHMYAFNGSQTRSQVLTDLTAQYRYDANLGDLNNRLAAANSAHGRSGSNAIKVAVTEANVGFVNPASDNLYGAGANSFVGGQFWAEFLSISMKRGVDFINFWSVVEGNNNQYNIGFIDYVTGKKKPIYYHFQLVAQNFNGTYLNGSDNQANVKAFGARNNAGQTVVMILNQDQGTNFNYTVRLDGNTASGSNPLKININSGIAKEYTGSINNQATQLLTFDGAGNLVKKIDYKLNGHADANLPPSVTTNTTTNTGLTATITPQGATAICSGSSVVLKANTGTGYVYQWKKNGVNITGATSANYTATTAGDYQVKIALGTQQAWSAPLKITTGTAPVSTITAGGPLTFASGGGVNLQANTGTGFTYVWKKNGAAISGATASSYRATSAGSYTVDVKNSTGCVKTSAAVTVNVTGTTTFAATVTPSGNATFCQGSYVTLKANTGTGYIYQWKKNGVNITGATGSTYNANSAGSYQVKITSGSKVAWSAPVNVTVGSMPAITVTANGSTSVSAGGSVQLSVTTGTGFTYQWKKDGANIVGAYSSTYAAKTTGTYYCYVTRNGACGTVSNKVNVNVAGTFVAAITASGPTSLALGGNVWLKANTGTNIKYQWKKNGYAISGATGSSYNATQAGTYTVTESYGLTTTTSNSIAVTISSTLTAKISAGGPTTFRPGGKVVLYSNTGPNYIYQWKKNGVNITGANGSTYTATTSGSYQVKLTHGSLNAWSAPLTITVSSTARMADSTAEDQLANQVVTDGDVNAQTAAGDEALEGNTYQFATMNDSNVIANSENALGAGGRKGTDVGREGAQVLNKTGAGGRKSSSTSRTMATEMDSTELRKMQNHETGVLSLKAFPNPTEGDLTITVTTVNTIQTPVKMELYNSLGQIVWTKSPVIENGFMNDVIQLDGSVASGEYFLRVREDANTEIMKIAVIR